jgi:hypothetical protein
MGLYFFLFCCSPDTNYSAKTPAAQSIRGIHNKEVNRVRIPMSGGKSARALEDGKTGGNITIPHVRRETRKDAECYFYPGKKSFSEAAGICRFLPGCFP